MIDFKKELYKKAELIRSKSLVKTVKSILDSAEERFWTDPCSSSGRFHPAEDQGESGLVRHLIKASYIVEQEARRLRFEDYEFDAAMAAVILHDIKKNGETWGENTDYRHGIIGAEFIKKFYFRDKTIKKMVMNAVRYHMAPWNTTIPQEKLLFAFKNPKSYIFNHKELAKELEERTRGLYPNRIEKAVQDADYWASREGMSYYPGITIMPDVNKAKDYRKHDSPKEWEDEILTFNGMELHIQLP